MPAIFSLLSTHFQYCLVFVFGVLLFESLVSVRFTHLKHLFFVLESDDEIGIVWVWNMRKLDSKIKRERGVQEI